LRVEKGFFIQNHSQVNNSFYFCIAETCLSRLQLASVGHVVEYAGFKKGDFRIDGDIIVEVGGQDKGFGQIEGQPNAYVAADDIESAIFRKIPLWAFGFLY
jgi:hypothetical protein